MPHWSTTDLILTRKVNEFNYIQLHGRTSNSLNSPIECEKSAWLRFYPERTTANRLMWLQNNNGIIKVLVLGVIPVMWHVMWLKAARLPMMRGIHLADRLSRPGSPNRSHSWITLAQIPTGWNSNSCGKFISRGKAKASLDTHHVRLHCWTAYSLLLKFNQLLEAHLLHAKLRLFIIFFSNNTNLTQ